MAALFAILIASIAARAPSVQLPIKRNNLPKVSDYSRVLNGQPFSMKYNNPKESQQTYILFVAADKINVSLFLESQTSNITTPTLSRP